jgi:hypothetical protein
VPPRIAGSRDETQERKRTPTGALARWRTERRVTRELIPPATLDENRQWDVFINYASDDEDRLVGQLRFQLARVRVSVWDDRKEVRVGAEVLKELKLGLHRSRSVVAVLSPRYFAKDWPRLELGGAMFALPDDVVIPVLLDMTLEELAQRLPSLACKRVITDTDPAVIAIKIQQRVKDAAPVSFPASSPLDTITVLELHFATPDSRRPLRIEGRIPDMISAAIDACVSAMHRTANELLLPEAVYEPALRELITNAIAHRSYGSAAPTVVRIRRASLSVESPGSLPPELSASTLGLERGFVLPNPDLASELRRIGLMEAAASGMPRIRQLVSRHPALTLAVAQSDRSLTVSIDGA